MSIGADRCYRAHMSRRSGVGAVRSDADLGGHDHEHDVERVAAVRAGLPDADVIQDLGATFGLLSDPSRLRLLAALLDGEMCVCDLAAACRQSESGVSHALRLLRAHRVVAVRRSGRRAFYRLADAHVRMLLDLGLAHHAHATPLGAVPTDGDPR
jgi:ArsR family transcriptional regulator, lead/cadmium/zinc/bismuth-responsive transcriptional repressor